jgi:iron complex outermembrane receptor protein
MLAGGLAMLTVMLPAQSPAGTGTVQGRISNATTGAALRSVEVKVAGTQYSTITEDDGAYRLVGVPAGEIKLVANYVGSVQQSLSVTVAPGAIVQQDFQLTLDGTSAETVKLAKFTVVADREMSAQAIAMNERKHAPNIQDVVALDEFGDRKGSIGQFLAFLPGVSLNFAGSNPTDASLRGFPSDFTTMSIDGAQMSSSFVEGRGQRLEEVSTVNIARVEVTKVPTPDMPASGLGGAINLVTKSGFESKTRRFTYDIYGMYHSWQGITLDGGPRGDAKETSPSYNQPSVDLTLLQPVTKNLAVTLGYSRYWEHLPMSTGTSGQVDVQPTWNLANLFQRQSQFNSLDQVRIRTNYQAGVDWRITPNDTLTLRFSQQEPILATTRDVLIFNYGVGATGDATFTQGAATAVGTVSMNNGGNNILNHTLNHVTNLRYRHDGSMWRIDGAASYSDSVTDKRDTDRGYFNTTPAQIANLIIKGEGIGKFESTIPTTYSATTRTGTPVDLYDGGNYSIVSGTSSPADTSMRRKTARLDFSRSFSPGFPLTVKVGAALDDSDRDNRNPSKTWTFRPNGATDVTSRLASNFDVFDNAFNATGPNVFGQPVRWISGRKLYDLYKQHPDWFVLDQATAYQNLVNNSREMSETITAGYLRADARLLNSRLWLVGGVRFEGTDVSGMGPINDITAIYQRDAAGNFVLSGGQRVLITTDALAQNQLRYKERGAQARQKYHGFYPSLNATYNLSDKLILRAAYARTIGRPQTSNIIPGATITAPDVASPTITVSNTALKPWTADSYDLSLESYQLKGGVGSIGLFYKKIGDFFNSVSTAATPEALAQYGLPNDPIYQNYVIASLSNGGSATVRGAELAYRQSLDAISFLPKGLRLFASATKLQVEGDHSADFSGFNPMTYAGGISLIRKRYFLKLTYNYQGEIRTGSVAVNAANGIPADTWNYQGEKRRLGVDGQYSLNKRLSFYVAIVDMLGFVQDQRRYAPDTPDYAKNSRLQKLGYFSTLGFRGEF